MKESQRLSLNVVLSLVAIISLTSCALPRPTHLSEIVPAEIGPIAVKIAMNAGKKPTYRSKASSWTSGPLGNSSGTYGDLLFTGIANVMEISGQSELNKISEATGARESDLFVNELRKKFVSSGYTVREEGPASFRVHMLEFGIMKESDAEAFVYLQGNGSLTKKNWKHAALGKMEGRSASRPWNDYISQPDLFRSDFLQVVRDAVEVLMDPYGRTETVN